MKPIYLTQEKISLGQMPMVLDHVGKWCFVYGGYFYGFFETEQEALAHIENFNPDDYIERSRYIFTLRDKILPYEDRPLGVYPLLPAFIRNVLVLAIA